MRIRPAVSALVTLLAFAASPGGAQTPTARAKTPAPKENSHILQQQPFYAPVFEKEQYPTGTSINDRCPVRHGKLNKNIKASLVNRQTVGYCCHGCPPIFTEDPGHYLQMLKLTVPDPVDPKRVASYDPKLRVFLNQEAFFFAGPDTKKKFLQSPLRYAGQLTDPVSQQFFTPNQFSPQMKYRDRTYYFESQLTQRQFAVSPKEYAGRREN